MPEEHPLMRTALRVLSLDEVVQDVGIGFEVMRAIIERSQQASNITLWEDAFTLDK